MNFLGRGSPSWGILTPAQKLAVKSFIRGRRIRDYGCGNLVLTRQLLELGARHVEGVDDYAEGDRVAVPEYMKPRFKYIRKPFHECPPSARMAFVSWPSNYDNDIQFPLQHALIVIYLGKNTDGYMCGTMKLWRELRRRRVLAHVPAPENDLIVYGGAALRARRMLPEEYGGSRRDRPYTHSELHAPGRKLGSTEVQESLVDLILEAIGL
jgi:hypothetical protein